MSSSSRAWLLGLLATTLVAIIVLALLHLDPLRRLSAAAPPMEHLAVERIVISSDGFVAHLRAGGSNGLTIAQVMVDGAFWQFVQDPPGPLARFDSARIAVNYPWVEGETHHLRFLSSLGATFDHTVNVAATTPSISAVTLAHYAVLGLAVGVVPIVLGMMFFPAIKALGAAGLEFTLALTLGLLGWLFLDMTIEGVELAQSASPLFGGVPVVVVPLLLTFAVLSAVSNRASAQPTASTLSALVAFGIGLHNFGEGLAIGTAIATHEVVLGTFLVIGFALHNLTEGVAIVAPLARERVRLRWLVVLSLGAGLPVIAGLALGASAWTAHWAAAFFGIGAGAVLQVIVEIDRHLHTQRLSHPRPSRFSAVSVAGYASGFAVMYATALLITL